MIASSPRTSKTCFSIASTSTTVTPIGLGDGFDGDPEPQTEIQVILERLTNRHYLPCDKGGLVRPLRPLGSRVTSGELIAILYDVVGNAVETIPSPIDGWVITYRLTGNRTATSGDMVAFVFGAA